jgi:DNA repair protein RadC
MRLKDTPKADRPREKLAKYGPERLSNSELLAILLRTGKEGMNVTELATRLLKKFGGRKLTAIQFKDLKNEVGLGPAKAAEIVACFELSRRFLKEKKAELYLSPQDVWSELKDMREHKKEHLVIFYLDVRNQEIKREVISVGTLNASLIHPREVFEPAVQNLAAQLIIAHNHPAGNLSPSQEDVKITKQLVEAGRVLGIELMDHIIVGKEGFFSFKQQRLI